MRRSDREIKDPKTIEAILEKCDICRLGLTSENSVYIVPLNFGWEIKDGKTFLYFHSASSGRKLDLIRTNGNCGFELDTGYALVEGENACDYASRFQSIIGTGKIEILETEEERLHGLDVLMFHLTKRKGWSYQPDILKNIEVLRLCVEELSCKQHD